MDLIFVFVGLIFLASIVSTVGFLIALVVSALIRKNVKKCAKGFGISLLCFAVACVAGITLGAVVPTEPETQETTDSTSESVLKTTEATLSSYANQSVDLNNLGQYPWGNILLDTLSSIGASDIKAIECEVDLSDVTLKVITETKRLWVTIGGKYGVEWYVKWIRNYDESEICYYSINEEYIYSYETDEVIHEPSLGSSSKYPFVVSANEFANEIKNDIDAAKEKYNGKWVKITGRVTDYSRFNSSTSSG